MLPRGMLIAIVLGLVVIIVVFFLTRENRRRKAILAAAAQKKRDEDGKITIQRSFKVTIGDKTQGNAFLNSGSKQCFYIDGMEAPTLVLHRGVYYEFKNESDEPLYFTTDPEGGYKTLEDGSLEEAPGSVTTNIPGGFKGHAKGNLYFMPTDDLPAQFYYQSGKHKLMGSAVRLA